MEETKRKFVVSIDAVSDWYEDNSEVAYIFSRMPSSEAYGLLASEHEEKMESSKLDKEHLPKRVTVSLEKDEDDDIDLSDSEAESDLMDRYEDEISEKCTEYVRYKMCEYDCVLPEGVDWSLVSCDGVVFEKLESEEGEDEGSKLS